MIEQKEPTRTQDERFVESRLRDRSSTNEPPGWFNDLVGKPLAYRLRWAAQRFETFRANNKSASLQWQFELKAYSGAPKDAISQGLVVAEQIQWVEDQDGRMQVLRLKKPDGTVHPMTMPVCASDESRWKTCGEFDLLVSLITDTVREAKSLYPDFIAVDSALARICDSHRRIGCDVPEWARLEGLQIPDGRYLLEGGDCAVAWYWSAVQPALVQLAINVEQRGAGEMVKQSAAREDWRDEILGGETEERLSVEKAAGCIQISERTIYRMMDDGLPYMQPKDKPKSHRRIRKSDVLAWRAGSHPALQKIK